MRKVIIAQFLTLDGVSQAPGGPEEDSENDFKYGGWQLPYFGPEDGEAMSYIFDNMGAMLLGRKTYDIFADYWPHAGESDQELVAEEDASLAKLMNGVPIYVGTHADSVKDWDNGDVTILKDVASEVNELRKQDGKDIIVWGSGDFAQTLISENLVDEYFLMIHPLILGTGKKLFRDGLSKTDLELIDSTTMKSGIVALRYRPQK